MNIILAGLTDALFPPRCMACGAVLSEEKQSFCSDCFLEIKFIRSPLCSCCGQPFAEPGDKDHLCGDCLLSRPPFSVARTLGRYEMALMDVIHKFKYGGKIASGVRLGKMMAESSYGDFNIADYSLIMPVPLHTRRLRERGFNQSMILAEEISRLFSVNLDFLSLRRAVCTESQTSLSKEMRERNIKSAFSVVDAEKIKGEKIILVDDVYTTGSTVKECARILLKNKAAEVAVLTLARA
ncbi:MAG TPA: ComF family protein [Syntrophales bacterium]|nr:ComF family protein [Syntrophales bacterium]